MFLIRGLDEKWREIEAYANDGGFKRTKLSLYHNGEWLTEADWDNFADGAYLSVCGDPSTTMMAHFITKNEPVEAVYRKPGQEWQEIALYADKPFPMTDKRVKWFKLENLTPGTEYEVRLKRHKKAYSFKTLDPDEDVTLALLSDQVNSIGDFHAEAPSGFSMIEKENTDLIVVAGDFVHDCGRLVDAWIAFWEGYFKNAKRLIPIVTCFGNHEGGYENPDGSWNYSIWEHAGATKDDVVFLYSFFSNLTDTGYGAIDIGDFLSLIFLNSGHTEKVSGAQTTWLANALNARADRTHIFPFWHVPPYGGWYNNTSVYTSEILNLWVPLLPNYSVKFVGNGHEHVNLVTKPIVAKDTIGESGVIYVGQGHGMGNTSRGVNDQYLSYLDHLSNEKKAISFLEYKQNGDVEYKLKALDGEVLYQTVR